MEFNVGDKVKVYRTIPSRTKNWNNDWVPEMNKYVNYKVYTIQHIDNKLGVLFEESQYYRFPEQCLKLVEKYIAPSNTELICIKIKQMEQRRKEKGYAY
jgi:hypothetical protein